MLLNLDRPWCLQKSCRCAMEQDVLSESAYPHRSPCAVSMAQDTWKVTCQMYRRHDGGGQGKGWGQD